MDRSAGLHRNLFVLLIITQLALKTCQEPLEYLNSTILEVSPDPHYQQRLVIEWDFSDRVPPSDMNVTFHIQLARSRKRNVIHDEYYNTSLSGSGKPFRWLWDSELPLECDSHSVRIRNALLQESFPSEHQWSAWSMWKTHYGKNEENRRNRAIYPHEKVVPEGADVSFCCLPGPLEKVQSMTFKSILYPNRAHEMKTESYVITVRNVTMTRSDGDNIICQAGRKHGTVLIVSRPPSEPMNFSCETHDLERLFCSWRAGPIYNFVGHLSEKYTLQERLSGRSANCSRENCTWPIVRNQQIYHFTLNVKNRMGKKSIQAVVNLTETVRPMAPMNLVPESVTVTNAVIIWTLKADYTSLVLLCQIDLKETIVNVTVKGKFSMEMYSASLTQLQPFTKYELRVRCMAESSLAGWGNWSDVITIRTQEAAPSAPLDVWREIQHTENGQTVTLYWKSPPGFSANGRISHYNIKWWPLHDNMTANKTRLSAQHTSYSINLGPQAHAICITAQNGAGVSPRSEIKVPGSRGRGNKQVNIERTRGRDGEINVRWTPVPNVHGYVVEWCDSPRSPHCNLQWKKYSSNIHGDVIRSGSFQRGVRYDFLIYGSEDDGEHLLEKLTGYSEELVSSKKPKVKATKIDANSLSLDWFPYPIDETQEGFVMGYTVYVKTTGRNCKLDASDGHIILDGLDVCRFLIKDPKIMNTTIHQLTPNTEYQVAVVAVTGGGESKREFIKASTPSNVGAMIMPILLPGILVSILAITVLIAGCWKRVWLKEMCYPNIPKPNKSKALSFSSPKGPARTSVFPDASSIPHKVERVYVLEKTDLKDESDQQPQVKYSTIQRPTNTRGEDNSADMYFAGTGENQRPLNLTAETLLYKPQAPTYLEFFNENYTGTSDDSYDESQGYRPQAASTKVHCEDPCDAHSPDTDLESCLRVIGISLSENEPVSPTSVTSTSFILKD